LGTEERIAEMLQQGWSPKRLIDERGFRKSTVYKVADSIRSQQGSSPSSMWTVSMEAGRDRFLPGDSAVLAFTVTNQSPADLYIFQAGVQPEWLSDQWVFAGQRKLLRPTESLIIRLTLAIPNDLPLGEKDLLFGIQGQWVGPQQPLLTNGGMMWAGPIVLKVQRPPTGKRVFLSHSVADMSLVNQLANTLDNYGIQPIVAESVATPGAVLVEKFAFLIQQADVIIALLTHNAIRSPWVLSEIEYAVQIGKPRILLRDTSLRGLGTTIDHLEWTEIDLSSGIDIVTSRVFSALQAIPQTQATKSGQPAPDDAVAVLGIALLAFLVGLAVSKGGAGGA
jgi:hypothetical protein